MNNEERDLREAHCQKEVEDSKGEVARLTNLLEQVLSNEWKGNVCRVFCANTVSLRLTHRKT
jgi:hypothetical protein